LTRSGAVLITGATGFIGRHLARHLAGLGYAVTSLQRSDTPVDGVSATIVVPEFEPSAIAHALSGRTFDLVFHLASYGVNPAERNAEAMFRVNVDVTRSVVQQAKLCGAKAAVISGSGGEYDLAGVTSPVTEQQPLETFKLYGASKAAASLCALAMARDLGLPLVVGRLFGVFGPGEAPHRLLPSLVNSLQNNERVRLSAGLQRRDALYVDDAVAALIELALCVKREPQVVVNISSGDAQTVRAFAEMVADTLQAPRSLLGFGDIDTRPDDVACFAGNPQRLFELTGWKPAHTLASGIRAAIDGMTIRART